jgi:uncharacterized iron-regulated membrane protein
MRANLIVRTIHAWSGAGLSLLLAVLGISGLLLVFKDDYLRASFPQAGQVVQADPATVAVLTEQAEALYGADTIRSLRFPAPDLGLLRVRLNTGESAYLDSTGAELTRWHGHARPEEWVFELHHYLLMGETGEIVIGIAGLCLFGLTLSGLYAVWPAHRSLGARVLPRSAKRRDLLSSHRNLGVVMALPLIVMALTGAGMIFPDAAKALMLAGRTSSPPLEMATTAEHGETDWLALFQTAQAEFPDATIRGVTMASGQGGAVRIRMRQPAEWQPNGRTYISADPANAAVLSVTDALSATPGAQAFNAFYPIHSGRLGEGYGARIYDFLLALIGLGLAILGLVSAYAFMTKPRRLRKRAASQI